MTAAVARTGVDHDAAGSAGGGTATERRVIALRYERLARSDPGAITRGGYDLHGPFSQPALILRRAASRLPAPRTARTGAPPRIA
jgi:hypothetical protein